jgi:anti-sigma factor RsiW
MKECIDEGTLQAWFDGELGREAAASIASHLALCPSCAEAARTVESETFLVSRALETEFAESIPTEGIRRRVETAIAENQLTPLVRSDGSAKVGWWESLRDQLFPSPQRIFGYAGLAAVIILSTIIGVVYLKRVDVNQVARNQSDEPVVQPAAVPSPVAITAGSGITEAPKPERLEAPQKFVSRKRSGASTATAGLLPGERRYVRTIAALDKSIKSDSPMRPSLQVEYEHNVAVLDSAIEMTRDAVKKNPRDTQASQFMFAAYQSKVNLLNQVADARRFNTQE